ncbi:MAG: hypothetical protein II587_00510 [Oscillospiraceae bacterium]|nr:hypothetical protein [Oscillospiraceae bacterium]
MTDFIHEKPKDPNAAPPPAEEAPISQKGRQKRVFTYAAILFGVAFVLILWSFLMTHRSNQLMISELKDRTNDLQSTVQQNDILKEEVARLEDELADAKESAAVLRSERDRLNRQLTDAQKQAAAMEALRQIEDAYADRRYDLARELILAMFTGDSGNDLSAWLPETVTPLVDSEELASPAAVYRDIVTRLYPDGLPESQG